MVYLSWLKCYEFPSLPIYQGNHIMFDDTFWDGVDWTGSYLQIHTYLPNLKLTRYVTDFQIFGQTRPQLKSQNTPYEQIFFKNIGTYIDVHV